jgi:uncharacterized protein (DUF427 family)
MDKLDEAVRRARRRWHYTGEERPPFAKSPGPGQESVWDYPRPPRIEPEHREATVVCNGVIVARTLQAYRVLETAAPPTVYCPPLDVETEYLVPALRTTFCEWKGMARYFDVKVGAFRRQAAAWCYPEPFDAFLPIAGYFAFYPGALECYLGHERVVPQPGGYYGGWITPELTGPFKGEPGSEDW